MSRGVEIFSREDFESILPEGRVHLGIVGGEYAYLIPVTEKAGILVRSSVQNTGVNAAVGEDSIRIYPTTIRKVASYAGPVWSYDLHGAALVRWVTRQKGWQGRVQEMVARVHAMIEKAGECSVCGKPRKFIKVKKEGPNHGRFFASCSKACDEKKKQFVWLD